MGGKFLAALTLLIFLAWARGGEMEWRGDDGEGSRSDYTLETPPPDNDGDFRRQENTVGMMACVHDFEPQKVSRKSRTCIVAMFVCLIALLLFMLLLLTLLLLTFL